MSENVAPDAVCYLKEILQRNNIGHITTLLAYRIHNKECLNLLIHTKIYDR